MDDLYFNLAKEEFSKSRKILLWVIAIIAGSISIWASYLMFYKHDTYATLGLTVSLYLVTIFLFLIAILSTKKRKEHFFKVDNETISYHYGLLFPAHHTYTWKEIKKIFIPPHSKNATLLLDNDKAVHINLTWVEKNKSRMIRKHIFYTAKNMGKEVIKKHYKK